jgi:hypothetical protein
MITGAFAVNVSALYDPLPNAALSRLIGDWAGTLTYRDWSDATKQVTLKTRTYASLVAPDELALFYVFDDGPGKTVYSYERMTFDFAKSNLVWVSGTAKPNRTEWKITSVETVGDEARIAFERAVDGKHDKQRLTIGANQWAMVKMEVAKDGNEIQRNRYEFSRSQSPR